MTPVEISLAFNRESLELDPLVVTNDHTQDLWIETFQEPGFQFRYGYAPESDLIAGSQLLTAVLEMANLPCVIYARAESTAALRTLKNEVTAAVSQFAYDLTLTVDGDALLFAADPTWPVWFTDGGMAGVHMTSTPLSIRVNPPGA